ncbi:MAG TPA: alpha-1,4-glucan--maltose-1-phosphate maltosyltransferase [Methylomirabilota bacterium]|nr:alpha-1,4-glucan--maltose-1-phosphate maltosyltransferase [Methylomirabilota bacterium]
MTTTKESVQRVARALIDRPQVESEPGRDAVGTRRGIVVERILPQLDGGRHPVKRVVGDQLLVTADIFADGHDLLDAALLLRADDEEAFREAPMRPIDNDRWAGHVELTRNHWHRYAVEAWRDVFATWRDGLRKKVDAGVPVPNELQEGRILAEAALRRAEAAGATEDAQHIAEALTTLRRARSEASRVAALGGEDLLAVMRRHADRSIATRSAELPLVVDRERARFGAWYELFPRSQGRDPRKPVATTFAEAEWRIPHIAAMGFDVVYLPPIHPIGRTNRKGRNNTLDATRDDVGSPYAIGSAKGGHDMVASELGGLEQLIGFREQVEAHGMELAMDIAIQAAPDHPYVTQHPGWFRHSPDGSIKYAENPPKKYQDIYPVDFYGEDGAEREALWHEWKRIFDVWIARGIKIFRVDNPHTKPMPFWAWLIPEIQRDHPEVIFLSEAFTKPKMMRQLAKIGFSQSYTYFTWRETPGELRDYFTELTQSEMREYFRANAFTNTPDINPHHLDHGRPAFVIRTVLAATLSSSYGIYSGWELAEAARLGDREEYLDSEKYEIRARDWDAKGNIKLLIGELNRLRHTRPALKRYANLRFEHATGPNTLFYRKALPLGKVDPLSGHPHRWRDPVYVAVNCDPTTAERAILHPDLPAIGIGWEEPYQLTDLLSGRTTRELGADLTVDLDPAGDSFRIFTISALDR